MSDRWSRRSILGLAGLGLVGAAKAVPAAAQHEQGHGGRLGTVGRVTQASPDPSVFLRTWNFSDLAPAARKEFYRETPRPDGTLLREYDIHAEVPSLSRFYEALIHRARLPIDSPLHETLRQWVCRRSTGRNPR